MLEYALGDVYPGLNTVLRLGLGEPIVGGRPATPRIDGDRALLFRVVEFDTCEVGYRDANFRSAGTKTLNDDGGRGWTSLLTLYATFPTLATNDAHHRPAKGNEIHGIWRNREKLIEGYSRRGSSGEKGKRARYAKVCGGVHRRRAYSASSQGPSGMCRT